MSIYPVETMLQKAAITGGIVELFDLDATSVFSTAFTYHFCSTADPDRSVPVRGGTSYQPIPIEAEGFDLSAQTAQARPKLRISNVSQLLRTEMLDYGDLVGATLTRWLVLGSNLDGGDDPDSALYLRKDVYNVEQKTRHDDEVVEWSLVSIIDQTGKKAPTRQIVADYCSRRYREWNGSSFDTPGPDACPYSGSNYFKYDNSSTATASEDQCRKNLQACKLRFPTAALPTRAFPGVGSGR